MICAFGAKAPIARPTNKTAPTPSENPATLIWPTRYPKPIARNAVSIGWLPMMSLAMSNMAEGRTNAGIAKQLWLTERTVETHVSSILGKLDLGDGDGHRRVLAVLAYLRAAA